MQSIKGPKACSSCAKAKARCMPSAGTRCERCQRLNRDCFSRPPAPPRAKTKTKRSRVAELEQRLDELSSHLQRPQPGDCATANGSDGGASPHTPGECIRSTLSLQHLFPSPVSAGEDGDEGDHAEADDEDTTDVLLQYHEVYAPVFPFVVVPLPHTAAAAALPRQNPYLWRAVVMASSFFDASRQLRLGHGLLADVAAAAYADGTHSLDVLQALLLLVGWFNVALKSTQLTNLLFLARSMSVGLTSSGCQQHGSLDHFRAYAGAYYLNTLTFSTNKRTDALMNTAQLDGFCRVLEAAREYPSDEYLVRLVRIQQLTQSISLTMAQRSQLPLTMFVQSFQQQINDFRTSLPAHLREDATLLNHTGIAEVLVSDVAISDHLCTADVMPPADRLQLLWSCVRSIRAFFDLRIGSRCFERPRFLAIVASDLAYAIITAMKLLMVRVPGWTPRLVVAELALHHLLDSHIHELDGLVSRRRSGAASQLQDPMERLQKLLANAKELVHLQLQKMESAEATTHDWVADDLGEDMWANFMMDMTWDGDALFLDGV